MTTESADLGQIFLDQHSQLIEVGIAPKAGRRSHNHVR